MKQARLLATLSSTAFFDALDFGCRTIAISDLGLQPDYGGHVYAGSGVWQSLEAIPHLDALDAEGHHRIRAGWSGWDTAGSSAHRPCSRP